MVSTMMHLNKLFFPNYHKADQPHKGCEQEIEGDKKTKESSNSWYSSISWCTCSQHFTQIVLIVVYRVMWVIRHGVDCVISSKRMWWIVSTIADEDFSHFTSLITSISRLFGHFSKLNRLETASEAFFFFPDVSQTRYCLFHSLRCCALCFHEQSTRKQTSKNF